MGLWERIAASREGYGVHCGVRLEIYQAPDLLAREFGLRSEPNIYRQVDAETARHILRKLLHKDMAYGSELLPISEANALANEFIELFSNLDPRFYTNGNWQLPPKQTASHVWKGNTWNPATDATFDAGILVLGNQLSGCAWFEDED
jgi:hypothetical protein